MTAQLPDHFSPEDVASHFGVPERTLRETAQRLGACRKLGNKMILLAEDIQKLMEGIRQCPSPSTSAATSGTTVVQLPEGDYEGLAKRLTEKSLSASKPKSKPKPGRVNSKGRGQR
tara:strand:+ start:118 stop:465 length:348 start_codon:yes stop_codon:yes gene_type:complete